MTYEPRPGGGLSHSTIFGWTCSPDLLHDIFYKGLTNKTHESRWWRPLLQTVNVLHKGKLVLREKAHKDDHANYHSPEPTHLENEHNKILSDLGESVVFDGEITMKKIHQQVLEGKTIGLKPCQNQDYHFSHPQSRWVFDHVKFDVSRETSPGAALKELDRIYAEVESVLEPCNPLEPRYLATGQL